MLVVLTVDDLGLHAAVRRAVEVLARAGAVTSASHLANAPDTDAAARVQGLDLGVHLELVRGRPVLPPGQVPSLVDPDGRFPGSTGVFVRRLLLGRVDPGQVEREWSAQIDRVRSLGVRPTHLDSEKHVHAWPALMEVTLRLARRHGIGWVRRPCERTPWAWPRAGTLRALFLRVLSLRHRPSPGIGWPDAVWGIAEAGGRLTPEGLATYLRGQTEAAVVEVITHPGAPEAGDPPLDPERGPMRVERLWRAELEALLDPGLGATVRAAGGTMTGFDRIDPATRSLRTGRQE